MLCAILVLQPEIKPMSPALHSGFLITGPLRKSHDTSLILIILWIHWAQLGVLLFHMSVEAAVIWGPEHIHTAPWHLGGEGGKARLTWGALSRESPDISGPLFPHVTSPHDFLSRVGGHLTCLSKVTTRAQAAFLRHRLGTDHISSVTFSWLKWVTLSQARFTVGWVYARPRILGVWFTGG